MLFPRPRRRVRKIVGFFQALVLEPEDVEAGFVAADEFFTVI